MPLETKRKLIKFSNYSFCITLPKEAIDKMGWKKGEAVNVVFDDQAGTMLVSKGKGKNKSSGSKINGKGQEKNQNQDIQPIPKLRW